MAERTCKNDSVFASCDEFICSKCGIHLTDWGKIEIESNDDTEPWIKEYSFRYCPNCGRRVEET